MDWMELSMRQGDAAGYDCERRRRPASGLDRDSRLLAIQYVRRYGRYRACLAQQREEILHGFPPMPDGQPRGGQRSDPTGEKVERLNRLERGFMARVVLWAVENAKNSVGRDILDKEAAGALQKAIWRSCLGGYSHSFEVFEQQLPVSRREFYRRKNSFLAAIIENMEAGTFRV